MRIKIPKSIKNVKQFLEWIKPTDQRTILAYTKRSGQYCFNFKLDSSTGKIEYLMADGVSVGLCKFENLNRYLYFYVSGEYTIEE